MVHVQDESAFSPAERAFFRELGARIHAASADEAQGAAARRVREALGTVLARRAASERAHALAQALFGTVNGAAAGGPPPAGAQLVRTAWSAVDERAGDRLVAELRDEALRGVSTVAVAAEIERLVTPAQRNYFRAEIAVLRDFLDAASFEAVRRFADIHDGVLKPTVIAAEGMDEPERARYRSSLTTNAEELRPVILPRVRERIADVNRLLRFEPFDVSDLELQYTVSREGDHYGVHTDNARTGNARTFATRLLSFVYYFHSEPKTFAGGELRVHDTVYVRDQPMAAGSSVDVVPEANAIVFFDPSVLHEVVPVRSTGSAVDARTGRRTVTGWLHGVRQR